jgi:hypothetical protein
MNHSISSKINIIKKIFYFTKSIGNIRCMAMLLISLQMWIKLNQCYHVYHMIDTPPDSLMDSTMSPKVITMEGERVRVHSLACSTLGQKGVLELRDWD